MPTLAGIVAALLAALAPHAGPVAAAHVLAPAHLRVLRVRVAQADQRTRTCNARGSNHRASRIEKQLAPVACEQPPRSKVILTFEGGLFGGGR